MTLAALTLVLLSALAHATWNLLAKRVDGGAVFVWLFDLVSVALYTPLALATILIAPHALNGTAILVILVSASLHTAYFTLLSRGYRAGDLSLVYPLARGTGPLLSGTIAILVLGERPSPVSVCGALLVVGGAVALSVAPRSGAPAPGRATGYALLTGAFIAAYTLVDKTGVGRLHVPVLAYDWGLFAGMTIYLTPLALRHRPEVRRLWQDHRWEALAIGVLSPLAYVLVLAALSVSPVSLVAPAREVGILFAALMGSQVLGEGDRARRLVCAVTVVAGILLLAAG